MLVVKAVCKSPCSTTRIICVGVGLGVQKGHSPVFGERTNFFDAALLAARPHVALHENTLVLHVEGRLRNWVCRGIRIGLKNVPLHELVAAGNPMHVVPVPARSEQRESDGKPHAGLRNRQPGPLLRRLADVADGPPSQPDANNGKTVKYHENAVRIDVAPTMTLITAAGDSARYGTAASGASSSSGSTSNGTAISGALPSPLSPRSTLRCRNQRLGHVGPIRGHRRQVANGRGQHNQPRHQDQLDLLELQQAHNDPRPVGDQR